MKNSIPGKLLLSAICLSTAASSILGQTSTPANQLGRVNTVNTINTAVPFLLICPDTRAGGMGEVGVSTSPDANSIHSNIAKLAFVENSGGCSISYAPWLPRLTPKNNLVYISGYKKIKSSQVIGSSLKYFSQGYSTFTDTAGNIIVGLKPREFAIDIDYSVKLGKDISFGSALRYIYSNIYNGVQVGKTVTKPGTSLAADFGVYYHHESKLFDKKSVLTLGATITNIGSKISYSESGSKDFIPTNLKLGGGCLVNLNDYNSLSFNVEFSKLLVPTPPIYIADSNGSKFIVTGENPNKNVPKGMVQSFNDAPNGTKEEFQEVICQLGLEYWYKKKVAFRSGYFNETETKGNRKFFTVGAGLKYDFISFDCAYIIPTVEESPLKNTIRFTLSFDFGAKAKKDKSSE